MVKRLLHIVFIGAVLACSDHSYRGDADAGVVEEELVPVMVVVGDPDHLIVTPSGKGQGAIDSDTKEAWEDASIYVFAFKRDLQTSFSVTSQEDSEWCLLDGSGDEMGSLAGKKARIGMLDSYVAWEGINRKIYYPQSNQPYDFYGYYIDDIPVEQEKSTGCWRTCPCSWNRVIRWCLIRIPWRRRWRVAGISEPIIMTMFLILISGWSSR